MTFLVAVEMFEKLADEELHKQCIARKAGKQFSLATSEPHEVQRWQIEVNVYFSIWT
jgi:hypothetical protein